MLHISKSLNKVWHQVIILKLQQNGINKCFTRFFQEEKATDYNERSRLPWILVSAVVPQSSTLDIRFSNVHK